MKKKRKKSKKSHLYLGPSGEGNQQVTHYNEEKRVVEKKEEYYLKEGKPYSGLVSDASCYGFNNSIYNDGYFHGKVEYKVVECATGKTVYASRLYRQGTINIGEFMGIVKALMILYERGDKDSPVWTDSKLCMGWVESRYTSTKLPMNEFTWEALDDMEDMLKWLKEMRPSNPVLFWDKRRFGENIADYGRKGVWENKKKDLWMERVMTLVDTFSDEEGKGSVLSEIHEGHHPLCFARLKQEKPKP